MKRNLVALSTVTFLAASAFVVAQSSSKSREQQVEQANAEFFQAMTQRNATSWNKRVADDAVLSGFGVGTISKSSAFASINKFASISKLGKPVGKPLKLSVVRLKIQGDTAVVLGYYDGYKRPANKPDIPSGFMTVLAKRANSWQVIAHTPTSVHP